MVDIHDFVGCLWEHLQQVGLLDVVSCLAWWLRELDCHCDPPGCHDRSLGRHVVVQAVLIVQYATTCKLRKHQQPYKANLTPIRDPNVS